VDVAVYRRDQAALRAFLSAQGWAVRRVVAGRLAPWPAAEWLASPAHEVHAASPSGDTRLEFLLNEGDDLVWRFRKAPAAVVRARSLVERRSAGRAVLRRRGPAALQGAGVGPAAGRRRGLRRRAPDARRRAAAWLAAALGALAPLHPWLASLGGADAGAGAGDAGRRAVTAARGAPG
jgi:hypothetical protein